MRINPFCGQSSGISVPRRTTIAWLGCGLLSAVAGCAATLQPSRTRLGELALLNADDQRHSLRVEIETGGETVFEIDREVPPADEPQPVLTRADGIPTDPAEYTVVATLDSGESIERTYPTNGGECYSVTVRIGPDGTLSDMPSDSTFDGCSE